MCANLYIYNNHVCKLSSVDTERQGVGVAEVRSEGIASGVSDGLDDDLESKVDGCSSWCGTNGAADALKWAGDG